MLVPTRSVGDAARRFVLASALFGSSLALLSLTGCGNKSATSPRSALEAYTDALDEGRLEDAYMLLSAESRAELSLDEFKKLVRDNPAEVKALVSAARTEEAPPLVTAEFVTDRGERLTLIYENGAWRIDESAVNLYDQGDPRRALESFVKAYDEKRYDLLIGFVPEADKEGLSAEVLKKAWEGELQAEMEQVVEGLRAHLATGRLEVLGDRATMSYGAGGVVELLREDGVWKIEDFQ